MADTKNLKILIRGTERAGVWYEPQMSAVQNVSTNQSTITITHKISVDSAWGGSYQPYNQTWTYVKIDSGADTAYALTSYPSISAGSSATVLTTTHTVSHGSDGTKTVTIAFRYNPGGSYTGTGSTTWTLSTIPRASGLTVPNFTMSVAGTITIDRKSSAFTHTLTWSIGGGSGSITVPASGNVSWTPPVTMIAYTPNATSGTITFTLKTFSGSTQIGSVSKSSTLTCPSRSTFSVGNLTMGTAGTITISRSAAYTHTLTWSFGGHSGSLTVPSSGNVTWTPPTSMMSYIPNALSGNITFTLTSKNGTATVGSYSLTKTLSVPAASSMSSGNFTMGSAGNITITRYASEFSHTLTWKFGNKSGSLTVGSGATVSWTPSLSDLCGQIPNAMSGTVTFTLTTKNGTATAGTTTLSKTLSLPNYTPSVSLSVSPSNSNATVRGWGVYVKGYTAVQYSSSVGNLNGASVASYTVTFAGGYTKTASADTSAVLPLSGSVQVKMVVYDSRGKSKTVTQTVTYYDYGRPSYRNQTAFRCNSAGTDDPVGTYLSKKIETVNSYSCGGHNAVSAQWRWKTANGGTWSAYTAIASGAVNVSSGLSVAKPYLCEFVVTDSLGSTSSITITIPTEKVPFNLKDVGRGAAFFGYAQRDDTLEVYGNIVSKTTDGFGNAIGMRGWNQIIDNKSFVSSVSAGATLTSYSDGRVLIDCTALSGTAQFFIPGKIVKDHKYLITGCPAHGDYTSKWSIFAEGMYGNGADIGDGVIFTWENVPTGNLCIGIMVRNGSTAGTLTFKPQCIDLTALFGAGNEPSTVAEFRSMFPADYYPYCSGNFGNLLWENASPGSAFSPQTVGVNIGEYSFLIIETAWSTGEPVLASNLIGANRAAQSYRNLITVVRGSVHSRIVHIVSNGIEFLDGYAGTSINNVACIPLRIYGIK